MTATDWLFDFKKRVDQLTELQGRNDHGRSGIWFGGLLAPEAYLIATQQSIAQQNSWSLEELELRFQFNPSDDEIQKTLDDSTGFIIKGLAIESAEYNTDDQRIKLTNKLSAELPTIILRWIKIEKKDGEEPESTVELPVYLNRSRKNLLTAVKIPSYGLPEHVWYQRGVSLFAS